jgi:hypothetical protein
MLIVVIVIGLFLGIKIQSSVFIALDNEQLKYHRSWRPDVIIRREEVKHIFEDDNGGITIKSIDPADRIYAPRDLENYEQFKMTLDSWKLIEKDQSNQYVPYVIGILLIVFSVGAFLFKEKIFFYLFFASLGVFVVYQFDTDIKSTLVTKDKSKRVRLALSSLVIGYVLYRFIYSLFS